ncbi:MAG: YchE family NAAT transporter [Thermodesulfovibrionales bacterium]|nr:YchE family NAAT transporter [Thermodesulfovibrionales bacterium]
MIEITTYIKIFTTLLAIVNPLGAVPVFFSLTTHALEIERKRIAITASITVAIVLVISALIGQSLLMFFGISIASFRVGGGILLLLMSISMMQARQPRMKHTPEEEKEAEEKESIAVVPIAMPLLAGPGAISSTIIYTNESDSIIHLMLIVTISIVIAMITFLTLRVAIPLSRRISKTGINIITRLMGLLLASIAIEFITKGLRDLLPALS